MRVSSVQKVSKKFMDIFRKPDPDGERELLNSLPGGTVYVLSINSLCIGFWTVDTMEGK